MSFAPVRKQRVGEQIAESIRDAILRGAYRPGEALPPERELAQQFEVNRSSVRDALQRLEMWGLLEVRQGDGTRVRDPLLSMSIAMLPHLLAPGGALDPKILRDLLEIRVVLLGWTAQAAAERRSDADVAALETILAELEAADSPEALQRLDFAFFQRLVESTQNRVIGLIANAVRQVYEQNSDAFVALYAGQWSLEHHRAAAQAVAAGQSAAARQAMESYGHVALDLVTGGRA